MDHDDARTGPHATEQSPASRDDECEIGLDLERPEVALSNHSTGGGTRPTPEREEAIDEILEDVFDLLKRMRAVEAGQREMVNRLTRVEAMLADTQRSVTGMRRDLVGERSALAARHAFDAVVSTLDGLAALLADIDPEEDRKVHVQLTAVVTSLSNLVVGLGMQPFHAQPGVPFDPESMECLGYAEGEPGVVVQALRPGYRAGEVIVRPAGVSLATTSATEEDSTS